MSPRPKFILDLANNHFGDLAHAKSTIRQMRKALDEVDVECEISIKLQFRNLDSYIHPEFKGRVDLHYIKRFSETRLEQEEFQEIVHEIHENGFLAAATPFDEDSVELLHRFGVDKAKVASASSSDSKLVKAITQLGLPTVASTGGLRMPQVNNLVRMLRSHLPASKVTLMHCVSVYPSPSAILNLKQIENFRESYPEISVGWSTHENPEDLRPSALALSLGANVFERHFGLESNDYKLNSYSSTPEQIVTWIQNLLEVEKMLGAVERVPVTLEETESLSSLKRGLFAKKRIEAEATLSDNDFYPAFPLSDGGIAAGELDFSAGQKLEVAVEKDAPLLLKNLKAKSEFEGRQRSSALSNLDEVLRLVSFSRTAINRDATLELSHHYGSDKFREFGTALFTCVNRNYAKKILVMLPRQKHPLHYHDIKEESFQLLHGDLQATIDGIHYNLKPGDLITVYPRQWHKFSSLNGAVLEEISTHHSVGDSFYDDPAINSNHDRKTRVDDWSQSFE